MPPLRQTRGTRLNTILEDTRESHYAGLDRNVKPQIPPQLKLQTTGLSNISRRNRIISPLSIGTASSCSDTEWQHQMQGLDELYDATDIESKGDERPSTTPAEKKNYLSLTIPPHSVQGPHKSSPVPPTPPPKISVSPAALSKLTHSVPAVHAPPSLDGSVSSDQVSSASAPATPDLQPVPDNDWNTQEMRVHLDLGLEDSQNPDAADPDASSDAQEIEIAIEDTDEDWHHFLGRFPAVPSRAAPHTSTLSLNLDAEPAREPTPDYGINLPEDALDLLRHIHLDGTPEPWSETSENNEEMWQVDPPQGHIPKTEDATPASALSAYSFTSLSIPSPGGFFAALTPRARHTWSLPKPENPSSAIAEDFYNLPFGRDDDGEIVEQVIEYYERSTEEGELTAVPVLDGPPTAVRVPAGDEDQHSPLSPTADAVDEIPRAAESNTSGEYDEHYNEELQRKASASRDRTSVWLAAQTSYLAALSDTNPVNSPVDEHPVLPGVGDEASGRGSSEQTREKSVRLAETLPEATSSLPSVTASRDSIYWRGFQYLRQASGQLETFMHRDLRFDAVQSNRLGLTKLHANRLSGNYELTRHERPSYKGPFSQAPRNSTLMSILAEKAEFSLLEKEQLVLAQIRQSLWAMDALRFLNSGSLLTSPASRRLAKAAATTKSPKNGKRHLRVLDLGGHATCEWGWYLAHDNPDVSVYTVFTGQQKVNSGIKGPFNHRQVSVSHLWKLPFGDNKFDVISARSLPALLRTECPAGEDKDEYDLCLQECYRCLKPGGYLEFFAMDAELSHAGPYASATSVEFAFNLRTRGYDSNPTKNFLSRLRKTNLMGINRVWMFLPMGVEPVKSQPPRETSGLCIEGSQLDSPDPVGSTANVASLTGLFGGWMWEQWLLKLQMEMGRDGDRLLDGMGGVFDEGRKNGAGWTCLSGWAMKPRRT